MKEPASSFTDFQGRGTLMEASDFNSVVGSGGRSLASLAQFQSLLGKEEKMQCR